MFINNMNSPLDHNNEMDVFPNGKCDRLLKQFLMAGQESQTPTGHHYLAIKVLNNMERRVLISHVITL